MNDSNIPTGYESVEDDQWNESEPLEHCEIHDEYHEGSCASCYNEDISEL